MNPNCYPLKDSPLLITHPHDLVFSVEYKLYRHSLPRNLDQLSQPRIFATHTHYTSLPHSIIHSNCRIVYICRNPLDNFVSYWHFSRATKNVNIKPGPIDESFVNYCAGYDVLESELREARKGTVYDEEEEGLVEEISRPCSFEHLKSLEVNKNDVFNRGIPVTAYFRKGEAGDYANHLTPSMVEHLSKGSSFLLYLCLFIASKFLTHQLVSELGSNGTQGKTNAKFRNEVNEALARHETSIHQGVPANQQVSLASFHLEGLALQWHRWFMKFHGPVSWKEFTKAILLCFGPIEFEDPSEALIRLRQTTTLEAYQENFEKLSHRIDGLPESFLIGCFIAGLRDDICLDVKIKHSRTLTEAIGVARLIEKLLIDGRSTHNFIDQAVVTKYGLPVEKSKKFHVMVANKERIECVGLCHALTMKIQGCLVTTDYYMLPMAAFPIVLDVQWLVTLGSIETDYAPLTMTFKQDGIIHTFQGVQQGLEVLSQKECQSSHGSVGLGTGFFLQLVATSSTKKISTHPQELDRLFSKFPVVFQNPTTLPP
ncbi:hypothetical protein FEM48_Zijuj03G0015100 [Ziziphus jujuba var. spinosa]|uniref:Sulfotransferase n=1 Tax=Ziziphus jujuba var. spinosa TaxID=714518 RepID=A0A978VMD4_ZIZJJ|nr:hypothetical protein FEM48_Zijuj03G0015100 [Ziziphus jujuba var. spinosa]